MFTNLNIKMLEKSSHGNQWNIIYHVWHQCITAAKCNTIVAIWKYTNIKMYAVVWFIAIAFIGPDASYATRRQGARVSTIGDSSRLSESLKKLISDVEEKTKDNSRLHLIVAVSYSGKYDVTQACKSIAQKVKDGTVQLEDIDESLLEQELETNCAEYPCPDLLIRTSGELRISNFLLWQLAYTELFFAEALWPDFGKAEFVEALTSYQQRQRRYGGRR